MIEMLFHPPAFLKPPIDVKFPNKTFQVEFKGMDIVKHGESAYPAQVL